MPSQGFLLDTNALIDTSIRPERLGKKSKYLIQNSPKLFFSPVSIAEIEIKTMGQKFNMAEQIYNDIMSLDIKELPLVSNQALAIARFEQLHGHDPFDRLLLSQAAAENLEFITSDKRLLSLELSWISDSGK